MKDVDEYKLVKEKYSYDPETGMFVRLFSNAGNLAEQVVGTPDKAGYLRISFNGRVIGLHRIAFLYMTGKWPNGVVDHKDGNVSNNAWDNLRDVTKSTNSRNRKANKNNTSGATGVNLDKNTNLWRAYVCVDGEKKALGSFEYKEDAIFARLTAEKDFNYWVDRIREDD